jgi:hypothetical protein
MKPIRGHSRYYFRSLLIASKYFRSPEFRTEITGMSLPLHLPALDMELSATPEQLSEILTRIQKSWAHMGTVLPHFSVLTERQFLPRNVASTIDNFWASGRMEAETIEAVLRRAVDSTVGRTPIEPVHRDVTPDVTRPYRYLVGTSAIPFSPRMTPLRLSRAS